MSLPIIIPSVVIFIWFLSGLRIAQEYERAVVFRLGRCMGMRGPGLFWIIPVIERIRMIDTRTTTVDVERQETITKDSVTIKVNAVLWYRVSDPVRSVIAVKRYTAAVYQAALTALRNIIGQHELDEVLKARDKINATLLKIVDEATDPWGIKVEMVEMKDVEIPPAMQRAMAREAEAVREKRARIIKAQAEQEASEKLSRAAEQIMEHPAALELRRLQMISEVGVEHNTTTIMLIPSDFVTLAKSLAENINGGSGNG